MDTPEYLNTSLARQLKEVHERLTFAARRHEILAYNLSSIHSLIPEINRLERIVNALESIGVNLDEEDIVALEWSAANDSMDARSHREYLRNEINGVISEVQERERETEQESAIEALTAAGFVVNDDDGETWTKGDVTVKIELVNGRESRYKWEYESGPDDDFPPLNSLAPIRCASGLSGEFHRLLQLIGSGNESNAPAGAETAKTMELKNDDYCPNCGSGDSDGCILCGRTVVQGGDTIITTTDDMLPGEFDSIAPASDERFTRVVK